MSEWASGYVSDVEYLPGLYLEQAPAHVVLTCLLNGVEPPADGEDFAYCELGCGQGVTANIIAASNPGAQVVALDFNPAHIARARAAAREAGIENVAFHELSFEEAEARADFPQFDMVTMHGVWSWISDAGRAQIVRFLARHLKPGGTVSVTYNAMPGWTALLPIQRLLMEHAQLGQGRSDERVLQSLEFVEFLQKTGSGVLGDEALLNRIRDGNGKSADQDRAVYLAHEYLNTDWRPLYHIDTARLLADAKMSFVGSSALLENFPDLALRPQQREALTRVPPGSLRETLKDYFVPRAFRRDVFVRGFRRMPDAIRDQRLAEFALAMIAPRDEAKTTVEVPAGTAELPKHFYAPMLDALAAGPQTLADLHAIARASKFEGAPSMVEIAGLLIGSGQCVPVPPGRIAAVSPEALAFNIAATREVAEQRAGSAAIALPLTSSGMALRTMEASTFHALACGVPHTVGAVTEWMLERIRKAGVPLRQDGHIISDLDGQRALVRDSVEWCFAHRVGLWTALGALPA
ncbi:class I SAM-dependent methyltransferase [Aquabacter spiritensis]|uniref:Methyltransferase family protein n=1 Tax=Aquabacter spiritensis TaxID=933073 RepID=A0A4R3LRR9_9HYPH|nr:class I SAM-dependent methyltransferase [Aquabacter spiritensis]TCT02456.1 methyltransferase family protein [Aquabacter spiritensis]